MMSSGFEKRGIQVSLNIPDDLPTVYINTNKLIQVLMNLVNYPTAKDRRASGFIDSTNVNASSRFCLASDWVPKPDVRD